MRTKQKKVDKFFLTTVLILVFTGVAMFISASLGILDKNKEIFYSVLFNQLVLGLGLGLLFMYIASRINYKFWRKYSLLIFLGGILLTLAVFIPSLGLSHGGAERWLNFGGVSFQPVEALKFGFVIYFAAWLSFIKNKVEDIRWGILPFLGMFAIIALILLKQPDTKSLILICIVGIAMLFVSGVPVKYLFGSLIILSILFGVLVFAKPYLKERVKTFIDPTQNAQSSSYQIRQSLIALGSGGIFGRGYGQSVQKFTYLPEAQGDSIFAVVGEELGFYRRILKGKPLKLAGTAELTGDLDRALEELKQEREASFQRLIEQLK